jgi:peroxiredoxin/YHS domain-containing protein
MKFRLSVPLLALAALAAGITLATRPTQVLAAPKKAPCAVCSVKEGAGPETVRATATYMGKEYTFCAEGCKQEFLKDPKAFLPLPLPRPAPAFSLKDLSGNTVSLEGYKGKVVLVDFWATFCAPCVKAMPKLQKLHETYGPKGFTMLGIATDEQGAQIVAPMVAKTKVKYPILISDATAWKKYGVSTLPALFLIDREGRIVKQFGGATEHKTIEREVAALLGE